MDFLLQFHRYTYVPFFLCFSSNTFVALVSFLCEVLWYWYLLHVPTITGWTCVLGLPRDHLYNVRYDCRLFSLLLSCDLCQVSLSVSMVPWCLIVLKVSHEWGCSCNWTECLLQASPLKDRSRSVSADNSRSPSVSPSVVFIFENGAVSSQESCDLACELIFLVLSWYHLRFSQQTLSRRVSSVQSYLWLQKVAERSLPTGHQSCSQSPERGYTVVAANVRLRLFISETRNHFHNESSSCWLDAWHIHSAAQGSVYSRLELWGTITCGVRVCVWFVLKLFSKGTVAFSLVGSSVGLICSWLLI